MDQRIYVQIAAYRDPELIPTIEDMLDKSAAPENLRICIAWQHLQEDTFDDLTPYMADSRFKILDMDARFAKGVCYARNLLNRNYGGERYTLQLDSHHRFAKGFDAELIEMLEGLRSEDCKKPLLSTYVSSYEPDDDPDGRSNEPWIMEFGGFNEDGTVFFVPHLLDGWEDMTAPVPSKFVAGGFVFADGMYCLDVMHDPIYYFMGEEINQSVRAYMAGYDPFCPHKCLIWHEYSRKTKPSHFRDEKSHNLMAERAKWRHRSLFGLSDNKENMLLRGVRSLYEYEKYAGLEFSTMRVHVKTLMRNYPPISRNFIEHYVGLVDPEPLKEEEEEQ